MDFIFNWIYKKKWSASPSHMRNLAEKSKGWSTNSSFMFPLSYFTFSSCQEWSFIENVLSRAVFHYFSPCIFQSENAPGITWASEQLLNFCQTFFNSKTEMCKFSYIQSFIVCLQCLAVQESVWEQTVYLMANSKEVFKVQMKFQHSKWEV